MFSPKIYICISSLMGICENEKEKSHGLQGVYFTNRIFLSLVLFSFFFGVFKSWKNNKGFDILRSSQILTWIIYSKVQKFELKLLCWTWKICLYYLLRFGIVFQKELSYCWIECLEVLSKQDFHLRDFELNIVSWD